MSGHSKWATIHRQKGVKDAARGNLFSKLARNISIAVKTGGGAIAESNFKLRVAIDKAKAANMPKENVERAIKAASGKLDIEEMTYEGFGPFGISVIVEVASDNRNRTGQEIKNLFERAGGSLAGPGAVSFNFESKGFLLLQKDSSSDDAILKIIDLGVEEVEETEDGIEVYVSPEKLSQVRKDLEAYGFEILETELQMEPKSLKLITSPDQASKALSFLSTLNDHEDVQKVYANLDVPQDLIREVS